MNLLALGIFLALTLLGLASLIFGLPGNFLVVGAAALAGALTAWNEFNLLLVLVLFLITLLGEALDFFLGALLARGERGGRASMVGAMVGGIAGGVMGLPLPVIGNVIGAFLGAFLGALAGELLTGGKLSEAIGIGFRVLFGRILSSGIKVGLGIGMAVYVSLKLV